MLLKIMEDVSGIPKLEKKIDDLQSSVEFMSKEYHDLLETCKKQENAIIKLENNVELLTKKKNSEKKTQIRQHERMHSFFFAADF